MKNLLKFILFFILILSIFSCSNKQKEYHYSGRIIPKHKFIQFLIDLHKTDGTLMNLDLWDKNLKQHDSLSYYNYLLKKYNINYMDFKRTLDYYMNDVDNFKSLYQIVVDSLKNRMYVLDSMQQKNLSKPNLWRNKQIYLIPFHDNAQDSIPFEIKNPKPGIYELSAEIMVYNDDQTFDLKTMMIVAYSDGSTDTATSPIYFKDSQYHKYITKILVKDSVKPLVLYGNLLDYKKTIYMHVKVRKIRLVRYDRKEMPWFKNVKKPKVKAVKPH